MNPPSTPPPSATTAPHHLTSPTSPLYPRRHSPYPQRAHSHQQYPHHHHQQQQQSPQHIQAPTSSLARRRRSAVMHSPLATSPTQTFAQLHSGMNGMNLGHGGQQPNGYFGFPGSQSPDESFPPTPGGFNGMHIKQESGAAYDLRALEEALSVLSLRPASNLPSPETTIKESFAQALSALNDIRRFGMPDSYIPSRSSTQDSMGSDRGRQGHSQSQSGEHLSEEVMAAYERGIRDIETARTMLSWAVNELKVEMDGWRERLK